MSDSSQSIVEMIQSAALPVFSRVIFAGINRRSGEGYERRPTGETTGSQGKQYSFLPGEEENQNPNRNRLFAPPTPPRVNTEVNIDKFKPATPPRFNMPFGK